MQMQKLPVAYMDITTLAHRWNCDLRTIQTLAENEQIPCVIRPVALEIALECLDVGLRPRILKILTQHKIDRKDIYRLFSDQNSPVPIKNISRPETTIPTIYAYFKDLVVSIASIKAFETKYDTPEEQNTFVPLNEDCSTCLWNGKEYTFGIMQANVIKLLWQARESGDPWRYGKVLLAQTGSSSDRIRSLFSHNPYWRALIISDKKGKYKLNLPPKAV